MIAMEILCEIKFIEIEKEKRMKGKSVELL